MTIIAQCQCGARFKAKPELAGKQVKCPSCGAALTVPRASAAPLKPAAKPVAKPQAPSAAAGPPIVIDCACGKRFNAPRHLLGKRVACPACKRPLEISETPAAAEDPFADFNFDASTATPSSLPMTAAAYRPPQSAGAVRKTGGSSGAMVTAPAVAMLVVASISALVAVPYTILRVINVIAAGQNLPYVIGSVLGMLIFIIGVLIIFQGGWHMYRRSDRKAAITGAVFCLLPCTPLCIGLPIGIWALIVLNTSEGRNAFH